jgi:hypothetical protein
MLKRSIVSLLSAVALTVFIAGCSKKQPAAAAQPEAAPAAAAPAADAAQADAPPPAPSGPVLDTSQFTGDPKQAMADADAALRQRNYEKAVQTLLAIQQAQLNAQQAEAARQQMIALQKNLMGAVDAGDPNAIAAAKALRASHRH